ncbi:DUF6174 domain-containing protein [Shewanella insulae]|uniref:DUF6174 domain-containing protein n=1 Tax=Shewanella insulae TaxID=2681496 RepID=UPI001EFE119B|nr:DUF6174 domain-containing protein [Shewanella insulae]MCG9737632.1 DUF6174 domain-containing protein [Shewanella insulae]
MQIFDTRKPISVIFVLGTVMVIVFSFWGIGYQFFNGETKQALVRNFELWKGKEPFSYSYKIDSGCMLVMSSNVLVVDGVAFYEHVNEHNFEITIDDIFKKALKGVTQAASIELKYHPNYFFPSSVKVDWNRDIYDDECFYSVSNFKVIE